MFSKNTTTKLTVTWKLGKIWSLSPRILCIKVLKYQPASKVKKFCIYVQNSDDNSNEMLMFEKRTTKKKL